MRPTLADAIFENYRAALERVTGLGPGAEQHRIGETLLIDAGVDNATFNFALPPLHVAEPEALPFAEVEGWFRDRGGFRFVIREPDDALLSAELRARRYRPEHSEPAMFLREIPPFEPTAGLEVQRVDSPEDLDDYVRAEDGDEASYELARAIADRAYTLPGATLLLGRFEGQPAARSMLFQTGEIAGVYNVFVRPEFRRRGFGAAMTFAALEAGAQNGAAGGTLAATEMARSLYSGLGFETVFELTSYYSPRD